MPVSGAVFGASIGLGIQLFSNGLRKVPMLRDPWEHAIFIGLGAYCGDWLVKYEERTAREVDDILLRRSEKNKNISKSETGPVV